MEAGRLPRGGARGGATPSRLDPFSLPVRFTAADEAADERLRVVDLHRERVVLRRSVRGIRMALNMPAASPRGARGGSANSTARIRPPRFLSPPPGGGGARGGTRGGMG